jgi:polar amino acid transport system substrate-binding protein
LVPFPPAVHAETITLSTADTPPYSNAAHTGLYDRIFTEAFARLGHDVTILRQPSDRSLAEVVSGAVDGEYARIAGLDDRFPSLIRLPVPLAEYRFAAFVRDPSIVVDSWDDLAPLHVAFINGWQILEENVTSYASLTRVPDVDHLFGLLVAGRVDVVLYELRRGEYHVAAHGLPEVQALSPALAARPMYLYLHRRAGSLVSPLTETLRRMQTDGTVTRLERSAFGEPRGGA